MMIGKDFQMPWWNKYTLTVEEAAVYFGIGEKTLRRFIKEHSDADFIIYNGTKIHIKKNLFEKYIDANITVL